MTATNLTPMQRKIIVALTLSSSFLSVLMMFLLITAYPRIMQEFAISSTDVQWLTTSFMLTTAVLIPITAYFIDTFKTRTVMISAMVLFLIGTLIGFIAQSFPVLIIGRLIQGIGSGIMIPLMQTILYLVFPREKRGAAMGLAGMITNVAPAVGPPLSGVLIEYFGWRSLFFIPLPIAGFLLLLVIVYMKNVTEQRKTEVDMLSILLSIIGFGGTLYGFSKWPETGLTDPVTALSLTIGIVGILLFSWRQLKLKVPTLEIRVLKVPLFILASILTVLGFSLLIVTETIMPMYVQNAQQNTAYYAGLIVMPGALTLALMSYLAGKLFDKYGGRPVSIAGYIIIVISLLCYYFILDLNTPFVVAMLLFMVSMVGYALTNMPIITSGINALPDKLIPHGTSVINTIRQFGGTIGLTFIISFISRAEGDTATIDPANYLAGVKSAFFVSLMIAVIGLFLSFLIREER